MADFTPKFSTLMEVYRHSVEEHRDRPFLGDKRDGEWQWMTFGAFGTEVDKTRGGLALLGIAQGDRVAIIANNSVGWAVAAYAAYGLGAAVVPMYESQLEREWRYILRDCGAKAVFVANTGIRDTVAGFQDELPDLRHIVVIAGDEADSLAALKARGAEAPHDIADIASSDVAGFIYTSGTTGKPKGVLLTHANLANNVSALVGVFPLVPEDRSLAFLPWAHSFGQTVELHTAIGIGFSVALAESVAKLTDNLAEVKPTVLISVPRIFNRIYDGLNLLMAEEGGIKKIIFDAALANEKRRRTAARRGKRSLVGDLLHPLYDRLVFGTVRKRFGGRLKYAFSGGAALSLEVAEFIDSLGITVYEGYGLTETSPVVTANHPGHRKMGSVGQALPGIEVTIDIVPTGDPIDGEIVVHGHCVMKGYHNLPEEDAAVFTADGGFRTGDIGHLDEDGYLFVTGRVKEQYKLENGKYVVPTPIEEQLRLSPFITNMMVYGANRPYNVGLVVPNFEVLSKWAREQGIDAAIDELLDDPRVEELIRREMENLSREIRPYERIKKFALINEDFTTDNGMLTPSLKVIRREVLKRYEDSIEHLYDKADIDDD